MMQAIILAAGMGKRLKELTKDVTKCMVKVNGVTLIERLLTQLDSLNLSRIVIVVGYKAEILKSFISTLSIKTPIIYVVNSIYDKTNNIYSLYLAKDYLKEEDTLLFESDLIFESSAIQKLLVNPYPNLALVAKHECWMDGTVVTIDKENKIVDFIDKRHFSYAEIQNYYKTVNIYKFSKEFSEKYYLPLLTSYSQVLGNNEYYEQILRIIILLNKAEILEKAEIKACVLDDDLWYEIDDAADLDIAESLFTTTNADKLHKFQKRYGGYWRYPKLQDYCYLVNPYYPPQQMIDEIKANFETLLINYPSGLEINTLLAAKYFGLKKEHVVIGNGASELINVLMKYCSGKIGIILPTFEEYANRKEQQDIVFFTPESNDFRYTADELIQYFKDKNISSLLLINPDNPSGNYLKQDDVLKLAEWTKSEKITLIVDESFIDFADTGLEDTLLNEKILSSYPNLAVMKSISKSFGVPGLRLGILASSDDKLLQFMKSNVSIWNINSFAEFYLQIFEKYQKEYLFALERFKTERKEFIDALNQIPNLRILPTQANYVMAEIIAQKITSTKLTEMLLSEYGILIKDLKGKRGVSGDYVRIAVKSEQENKMLVDVLNLLLSG